MLKHSPRMAAGTHGTTGQTDHKKARVWAVVLDKGTAFLLPPAGHRVSPGGRASLSSARCPYAGGYLHRHSGWPRYHEAGHGKAAIGDPCP